MIKKCTKQEEYLFVLNNLRSGDKCELKALFGEKWYEKTVFLLKDKNFLVFYGEDFQNKLIPAAIGGFNQVNNDYPKIACVWLLTSKYIHKNRIALLRALKKQFRENDKKYQIMFNYIYKSNHAAKFWLRKFGFCFDNPAPKGIQLPENYEFFYKVNDWR